MVNPAILLALDFKNFVNVTIVTSALKMGGKLNALVIFLVSLPFHSLPTLDRGMCSFSYRKADAPDSDGGSQGMRQDWGFHHKMCHMVLQVLCAVMCIKTSKKSKFAGMAPKGQLKLDTIYIILTQAIAFSPLLII